MSNIIDLNIDNKIYSKKSQQTVVLRNFLLHVEPGDSVAVVGESGSGKSTLLNILGVLDRDFNGSYYLFGKDASSLSDSVLADWRNSRIGFSLQEAALIETMTMRDNILLPFIYSKSPVSKDTEEWFDEIVDRLSIGSILEKKPLECSGGEKARVCFARSIVMKPELILCDEVTASLDDVNSHELTSLLMQLNKDEGVSVVSVTHDSNFAGQHSRIIELSK